jgi:hypothetical protein
MSEIVMFNVDGAIVIESAMDLDRRKLANLNKTNIRTKKILLTSKHKKARKTVFNFNHSLAKHI